MNFKFLIFSQIGDFGTSRLQLITSKTTKIKHEATITHAAPEYLHPKEDFLYTEKCDVWR